MNLALRRPITCAPVARAVLLLAVAALFVPLCQGREQPLARKQRTLIESAVARFMAAKHAPGLSVAVVEDSEYRWSGGFGFADLEGNVPATEHTLYRLASISKTLTAVGAMQLWERGQLDLDAPVQKYCPSFPAKPWMLTTRQVMGHVAGIRHYKSDSQDDPETGNIRHFGDPIQAGLGFFRDDPLLTQPGAHYHYSTQGYTLVGCVMEGASGTSYADFMRRHVFIPAGMQQTQADDRFAIIPYRTRFYRRTDSGAVENADFLDSSYKLPGGGWLSSAEDMARFEVAILKDQLLHRATLELMWKQVKPGDGTVADDRYGLGWEIQNADGVAAFGHTGGQQGTSTAFLIAPAARVGVVVLANMEGVKSGELALEILQQLTAPAVTPAK